MRLFCRLPLKAALVLVGCGALLVAQTPPQLPNSIVMRARGSFAVKLDPQNDAKLDPQLARMTIHKSFHGDLEATSEGEMLSASTEVKGSAGYVAIEKVTGKLGGRSGSFILQHTAVMTHGVPQLNVVVVPDSGTGELSGLRGRMRINVASGNHTYEFEYVLGH